MKLFACPVCAEVVYFENTQCVQCRSALAFDLHAGEFHVLPAAADPAPTAAQPAVRACRNRVDYEACNWTAPVGDDGEFCLACRLNQIIPDLSNASARFAWIRLEAAKRRLIHTLHLLGLPVIPSSPQSPHGLAFAFKQDGVSGEKVLTGHADGLITINIAEADDASRENVRFALGEPYRTILGHFRHETGHYYWDRLIKDDVRRLESFRAVFGDEQADYLQALQRHYAEGARADWRVDHVSSYASAHPWEDWAETWAHYLHMVDGVETVRAYGLTVKPDVATRKAATALTVRRTSDDSFDAMLTTWMPATLALNSFNRGMGLADIYPFTLSERAITKLRFVDDVVRSSAGEQKKLSAA